MDSASTNPIAAQIEACLKAATIAENDVKTLLSLGRNSAAAKRGNVSAVFRAAVETLRGAQKMRRALEAHHRWQIEIGPAIMPATNDQDCPIEIDLSGAYVDSKLCDDTLEALNPAG